MKKWLFLFTTLILFSFSDGNTSSTSHGDINQKEVVLRVSGTVSEKEVATRVIAKRFRHYGIQTGEIRAGDKSGTFIIPVMTEATGSVLRALAETRGKLAFYATYNFTDVYDEFLKLDEKYDVFEADNKARLFDVLQLNFKVDEKCRVYPSAGPVVGFAHLDDTVAVRKMLKNEIADSVLPGDMKLIWSKQQEGNVHKLIALKAGRKNSIIEPGIIRAKVATGHQGGPEVHFLMDEDYAVKWKQFTAENTGKNIAIVFDGEAYSWPEVMSEIGSGNFIISLPSEHLAKLMAAIVAGGKLTASVKLIDTGQL